MKKDGYAESTIKTTGKRLRMMKRHGVNLNDPEAVKEYIAAKESATDTRKFFATFMIAMQNTTA